MTTKRPSFEDFKEKALQDAAFRAEYEALRPEFELLIERIKAWQKKAQTLKSKKS